MRIDILTVVPELLASPLNESILKRAQEKGLVEIHIHNIRDYTEDKHRTTDDYPFGGEAGMVMKIEPIYRCIEALKAEREYDEVIYTSPDGIRYDQHEANRLSTLDNLIILCVPPDDWYKGYDYRAIGEVCDKVILMAHDYQWTSVPEGYVGTKAPDSPVTPFPDIYRALSAITDPETGVQDKSKIVLQVSFAAVGFEVDENGLLADTTIYRPAPDTVAKRLAQADTVVTYDESDRNPSALYTTEEGMTVRLWYEDARSVADKLTLARMMGITGVSVWRLGNVPTYSDIPDYDAWSAILAQR